MLSKVELRNFRGFDKLALDLEPVSVVVGPNSSGKTTVLHAISVALRAYSIALDDAAARPVAKGSQVTICSGLILRDHTQLLPIAERNELFCNGTVFEGATATITLTFDGPPVESLTVSLSYMRNAVLKLAVSMRSSAAAAAVAGIPAKSKNRFSDSNGALDLSAAGAGAVARRALPSSTPRADSSTRCRLGQT